jgi:hypothetical protein
MSDQNYGKGTQGPVDVGKVFGGDKYSSRNSGYKPKRDFNFMNAMEYWLSQIKPFEANAGNLEYLWAVFGDELHMMGSSRESRTFDSFKKWLSTPEYKKGGRYGVIVPKPGEWDLFLKKIESRK